MPDVNIAELRRLLAEATPLPYAYEGYGEFIMATDEKGLFPVAQVRGWGHYTGQGHGAWGMKDTDAMAKQDANGALLTAAVNALPDLLDEVERLTAMLDTADASADNIAVGRDRLTAENASLLARAEAAEAKVAEAREVAQKFVAQWDGEAFNELDWLAVVYRLRALAGKEGEE